MIIKCPNCGRRFDLQRRPPVRFVCPKCSYSAPFSEILGELDAKQGSDNPTVDTSAVNNDSNAPVSPTMADDSTHVVLKSQNQETKVVAGLNGGEKTELIPSLQPNSQGALQVIYNGVNYGIIKLPRLKFFNLGRRSSDSKAQVKLTPDMTMSRVHAGMRILASPQGTMVYQITSAKDENPVYVNGVSVPKGKPVTLKNGDLIKMGETSLTFRLM